MQAKQDRFKPPGGENSPPPLAIHTHEVQWFDHGFRIIQRCYCEKAAQGMARFQRRMGNDASVVKRVIN